MKIAAVITQERLKEILHYDPETGVFTWRIATGRRVKSGDVARSVDASGYLRCTIDNRSYRLHRLAWFYLHGVWPNVIDHINRNASDNRAANLRSVTRAQNQQNMLRPDQNKSGHRGVYWHKQAGKWGAKIMKDYRGHSLGLYDNIADAVEAYKAGASKYHTHNQECV